MKRHQMGADHHHPYSAPATQLQHADGTAAPSTSIRTGFSSRPDSFPASSGPSSDPQRHPYKKLPKLDTQWQWERERDKPPNPSNRFSSPQSMLHEDHGADGTRPYYHVQRHDSPLMVETQVNKDVRNQMVEQDMELGYDENPLSLTYDGHERKFLDDLMKLLKEQYDAEDIENARHRERIIEINARYHEKLLALRAKQLTKRDELLRKESQARLSQYQLMGMPNYPSSVMPEARSYTTAAVGGATAEPQRPYNATQFDTYRDRPEFAPRSQGTDGRGPLYPDGRPYSSGGARYY